jgi:acetyl-CoA acyltransferase
MGHRTRRVAIVSGLRTPFAKQGTAYRTLTALDLGKLVVAELVKRCSISPEDVGQLVFGQVVPSLSWHNLARDVALAAGLPPQTDAYSVSRACATSYQATVNLAEAIWAGDIECGIAGGADSASDIPVGVTARLRDALLRAHKAKSLRRRMAAFAGIKLRDLRPVPMAIRERTTGLTMGQSAEKMAKENGITRSAQDEYAHRSHRHAARAWEAGHFGEQVMQVFVPPDYSTVAEDNLVRRDSNLDGYAKLPPVFDREHGTVTAGNSSPLTDGASALLLMSEEKARAEGRKPLGYLKSFAFSALDPAGQLLMGPAYATPLALDRAGLKLSDMDLIDMHEAFAAQVLSNTQALESATFAALQLGRGERIGVIDWDRFNVSGGSLSIGHPFAATGARQIMQALHDLRRRGGELALCTTCAAGGLGAALVLEAAV